MITNYNDFLNESLRDKMTPVADEKIIDKLKGLSIPQQLKFIKDKGLPEKFYPISKEEMRKKLDEMDIESKLQYIDAENIPCGVYNDDTELMNYLDDSILGKIKDILIIRYPESDLPSDHYIRDIVSYVIQDNELDDALYQLQDLIGQELGDYAGIYFSKFDDPDEYWSHSSIMDRRITINEYLDHEELSPR